MTLAPEAPVTPAEPIDNRAAEQVAQSAGMKTAIAIFIIVPLIAVALAIPVAWGGFLGWSDVIIGFVFYVITGAGITLGYHRYFTHGSFKTNRTVKILLAVFGSMAVQGSLAQWVADHRKHHMYSDEVGDPHSPWRFGFERKHLLKGLYWAHMGWLFDENQSNRERYAPDMLADPDLQKVTKSFIPIVVFTLLGPAVIGGLVTWSWWGALTAFFWASLIRIAIIHHVTWSINSITHVYGKRPFNSRDYSGNVAWLAPFSFGESWHNLHHAEPTAARHGVLKGQLDISARTIWVMEKLGLATDVRWPKPHRLANKLVDKRQLGRIRGITDEDVMKYSESM